MGDKYCFCSDILPAKTKALLGCLEETFHHLAYVSHIQAGAVEG
jgi:hypothetical protein